MIWASKKEILCEIRTKWVNRASYMMMQLPSSSGPPKLTTMMRT
jgi:hypothetical protein